MLGNNAIVARFAALCKRIHSIQLPHYSSTILYVQQHFIWENDVALPQVYDASNNCAMSYAFLLVFTEKRLCKKNVTDWNLK